jgi:photosystem II stability/assembly factor-like uncharacterized protein
MRALLRFIRPGFLTFLLLAGVISLAAAEAPPTPAKAAYTWRNVAIKGGGYVTGLVFHPGVRDLLYARTDVGGAFRWDAGRRAWVPLNDALGRNEAELLGVVSLAVDPVDPRRLYLACGSYLPAWAKPAALLWSTDQGAAWDRVALPFRLGGNADGRQMGERLQVDPHHPETLLLGTNQDGLWRSRDRARTWERVAGFPGNGLTFVLFDPHSGGDGQPTPVIYAGAADLIGPALFRSIDAGTTWSPVPGQPRGFLVHHAAVDDSGALYLTYANNPGPNDTTDGAVWKLQPTGDHWTNITPVAPGAAHNDRFSYAGLAIDGRREGVVLVSTLDRWTHGDEIFRSTDGGANWKPLLASSTWDKSSAPYCRAFTPHWIGSVALDPFDANQTFFVTGYGVWTTRQASAVERGAPTPWTFVNDGLEETVVAELASPPTGAPLLSALFDLGGFRHDDLTVSPAAGALQTSRGTSTSIAVAELSPAKMVRTHSGPARGAISFDGGVSWNDFPAPPPPAVANGPGSLAISSDGRRLVWLPKGSGPFFSADDGVSWKRSESSLVSPADWHVVRPVADPVNSDKFYIYDTVTGAVFLSTDAGGHFVAAATLPAGGGAARSEPGREGRVWVPTPGGLYWSGDSGRSFLKFTAVEQADQIGFGRAAPGGNSPAVYLAGQFAGRRGLWRSDDDGMSWVALNGPSLQFGWINAVCGDPRVYGRVYVGTGGRGIFYGEPAQP